MKNQRHGKAKILTQEDFSRLIFEGFHEGRAHHKRDRALFAICFFTACRINECVTLMVSDVYDRAGRVMPYILFRKAHTKGKLATRNLPITPDLRVFLEAYCPLSKVEYLFPNGSGSHMSADYASHLLRRTCIDLGFHGVSTHSFRRSALTALSNNGIPLRIIQEVSGHRNLEQLSRYLEVRDDQLIGALASLSTMAPSVETHVEPESVTDAIGKRMFVDRYLSPSDAIE